MIEPVFALPPLREVIATHELAAKKALGQNFLLDSNLTDRIARTAGDETGGLENGTTIEIGAGPGGLTRSLLSNGATVIAVEKDRRCLDILAQLSAAYPNRLTVIEGDALTIDVANLGVSPRRIVANLPYNVATPLLIGWLRNIKSFVGLTLMFQKEVAERICAKPNEDAYGRLGILVQWLCEAQIMFTVNRAAFTPPPKVTSAIVHLKPRETPLAKADFAALEKVTAAAFGQRRKMLRSSLKSLGNVEDICKDIGIDPTVRGETLTVEDFCAIACKIGEL